VSSADSPALQVIAPRRTERVQSVAPRAMECAFALYGDLLMRKLLEAYKANPTKENAKRVFMYDWKHAFASVLLFPDEQALLQQIIARHNRGE